MKSALVGFGRIGNSIRHDPKISATFRYSSHAEVLNDHPDFDWVGTVDTSEEAINAAEREWGVSLLQGFSAPEFAVLAIPPDQRLPTLKKFTKLKSVLVEKPLGKDGQKFLDYCQKKKIQASINYWRRGCPYYRELAGVLEKSIGKPQAVFALYGNGLYNNGSHLVDFCLMLFGNPESVKTIGAPERLDVLGCSGPADDYHASFVLEYPGFQVSCQAIDYNFYREFSLDIWAQHGRLFLCHESLSAFHYLVKPHRAMTDQREIYCEDYHESVVDPGRALYNLYTSIAKGESLSPATMDVQNILDEVVA